MITANQITEILLQNGNRATLDQLVGIFKEKFPELGYNYFQLIDRIVKTNSDRFSEKNGLIVLTSSDRNFIYTDKLQSSLIDTYLEKLYSIFRNSQLKEPLQHFASLVLFDRLYNYHFAFHPKLKEVSTLNNPTLIYTSINPLKEYWSMLESIDKNKDLERSFDGVLKLFVQEDKLYLESIYIKACRICMEFHSHVFDAILFGKRFNRFLNKANFDKRNIELSSSPELISRLIPQLLSVEKTCVIYDPAVGYGSFFVEIAHYFNIYDFKAIGRDFNWGTASICKINMLLNGLLDFDIAWEDSLYSNSFPNNYADIAICNPPFGIGTLASFGLTNNNLNIDLGRNYASLFISLLLQKTNSKGIVISVVSDSVLFSKQNYPLRRYVVDENILQIVCSLPLGTFYPHSNINSNLILIDKGKSHKAFKFIDGRNVLFTDLYSKYKGFSDEEIGLFLTGIKLTDPKDKDGSNLIFIQKTYVSDSVIHENEYDLSPIRYTNQIRSDIEYAKQQGEFFVALSSILLIPQSFSSKDKTLDYPFLRIQDLRKDNSVLFYEQIKNLSSAYPTEFKKLRLVEESVILVARVGSELKPTLLKLNTDEKIYISDNIHYFKIDTRKVNEDYLIGQLNSTIVKQQADVYRTKIAAPSLSKDRFLKIEIPLPSLPEQFEWVAKNVSKTAEKNELASFIKSIPLIENSQDIKNEIERFTMQQFNSSFAEFKRFFEYDKFPFSNAEVENLSLVKKTKQGALTVIALQNDEYGIFGAVTVADENPIDAKKAQTINEYAAFLTKIFDFLSKSSINRQLDSFAHTSRNFFFKLQGEIQGLIDSKNSKFQSIMDNTIVQTDEIIDYYLKKGTKVREDFLLKNQLISLRDQTSAQYKFYDQIHKLYTEIKNEPITNFNIQTVLQQLTQKFNSSLRVSNPKSINLLGKEALLVHALIDLIDNGIKYSSDGICQIDLSENVNSIVLSLSNFVSEILPEDKYLQLGQSWIKNSANGEDRISSGIYYAFQMIKESMGEANLVEFKNYKYNKTFKVLIQLRKND